jgi:3-oxoacyl-(acyl-carrier-protein) synthase
VIAHRIFVSGAGAVTWSGRGLAAIERALAGEAPPFVEEQPLPGRAVRVGRIGKMEDADSAAVYKRWGQLDTYSRYGFVAARLALEEAGLAADEANRSRLGVLLGTAYGCMEENQKFDRYEVAPDGVKGASPLIFKGTVDNAPAGWIAVAYRLKGMNATFTSGDGAAMEALWSAEGALRSERAPALLTGGVERYVDLHSMLRRHDSERQAALLSEGAAVLLLEREDALRARGRDASAVRAELAGTARVHGSFAGAAVAAMRQIGIDRESLGLASLAFPSQASADTLRDVFSDATALVADKEKLGEFHGAWGGVAACAALTRMGRDGAGWNGRPCALVHGFGEGREHFFAVLRDPRHQETQ